MTEQQALDLLAAAIAMRDAPKTSQAGQFLEFAAACDSLDAAIASAERGVKDEAEIVEYLNHPNRGAKR